MAAEGEQIKMAGQPISHQGSGSASVSRAKVEALIKEHYSGLRLLILKATRNEATAADILNDAIATSWEHLQAGRIAQPEQIAGYVYQVAMNHLRNHRRKMDERGDKRVDSEMLDSVASDNASLDELAETAIAQQVRRVIQELPTDRDRLIVKRFYLDEDDKDAICRDLSLSALHFDKVIFRARQRMRTLIEKHGFKPSDFFLILCAA
jgi:RNA polymerase sigma-70 factor, ECF subfamily